MASAEEELKALIKSGRKIEAIKMLREHDGVGLKEAKEKVEALQQMMVDAGELDASAVNRGGCAAMFLIPVGFFLLI